MKNHLTEQCKQYPLRKKNTHMKQKTIGFEPIKEGETIAKITVVSFSVKACRKAQAEMIITDEFPFRFVEGEVLGSYACCMLPNQNGPKYQVGLQLLRSA